MRTLACVVVFAVLEGTSAFGQLQGPAALETKLFMSEKSKPIITLPPDEWWNRPLDRERDPPLPFQEWDQFWKDGTLPVREATNRKPYDYNNPV